MKKRFSVILCLLLCLISFNFAGCNEKIYDHDIFVSSENQRLGTVIGSGTYKTNEVITITAVTNPELEADNFVAWIKDNKIVSYQNPYEFIASKETEGKYIAVFNSEYLTKVQLTNFNYSEMLHSDANIHSVKSIKLTLDNKDYDQYQLLNIEESINKSAQNSLIFNKDMISEYVFDTSMTFYGSITITYLNNNQEEIVKTTNFSCKKDDVIDNQIIIKPLTKPINITDDTTESVVTLTFTTITHQEPTVEEE